MTAAGCRAAIETVAVHQRAVSIDTQFPRCSCEPWSLTEAGGDGVAGHELIARVMTSPDGYNESEETIIAGKLTQLYAGGLSTVRQGASDDEILATITELMTGGEEQRSLVGAVVMTAEKLRLYANDDDRWFGVYATDDRGKHHHIDVFGTVPAGGTSARERAKRQRRYKLAEDMLPLLVYADEPADLLARLRAAGI